MRPPRDRRRGYLLSAAALSLLLLLSSVVAITTGSSSSKVMHQEQAYVPPSPTFTECQSCKCKGTQKPSCPAILQVRYTAQHQLRHSPVTSSIFPTIASVTVPQDYYSQPPHQHHHHHHPHVHSDSPPTILPTDLPAPTTTTATYSTAFTTFGTTSKGLPDLAVAGGLLLAGQWDVISSNDVRLRNTPMSVEINADKSVRLITRLHHFGLTYRVSRDAEFELTDVSSLL